MIGVQKNYGGAVHFCSRISKVSRLALNSKQPTCASQSGNKTDAKHDRSYHVIVIYPIPHEACYIGP